jgi:two-component system response regulator EvgA
MKSITCLIVDDHPAIRMGIRYLLTSNGFDVIAEATNGVEAVQAYNRERPDVIILDINIPVMDGNEVIKRVRASDPDVKIIVLSSMLSDHDAADTILKGVNGYLKKTDSLDDLAFIVRHVSRGYSYIPDEIVNIVAQRNKLSTRGKTPVDTLSSRERNVMKRLMDGQRNKEIANEMMLSAKTVSTYKTRVLKKLNVSNIPELIAQVKKYESS